MAWRQLGTNTQNEGSGVRRVWRGDSAEEAMFPKETPQRREGELGWGRQQDPSAPGGLTGATSQQGPGGPQPGAWGPISTSA